MAQGLQHCVFNSAQGSLRQQCKFHFFSNFCLTFNALKPQNQSSSAAIEPLRIHKWLRWGLTFCQCGDSSWGVDSQTDLVCVISSYLPSAGPFCNHWSTTGVQTVLASSLEIALTSYRPLTLLKTCILPHYNTLYVLSCKQIFNYLTTEFPCWIKQFTVCEFKGFTTLVC